MSPVIIPNLQLDNKTGNVLSVRCFGGKTLLIIDRIKLRDQRQSSEDQIRTALFSLNRLNVKLTSRFAQTARVPAVPPKQPQQVASVLWTDGKMNN